MFWTTSLNFKPMNLFLSKILLLTALGIQLCSCSGPKPPVPKQLKQVECIVWNSEDSMAMNLVHRGIGASRKVSIWVYDSVARINHRLPGMFLSAGKLYELEGDNTKAMSYYQKETEHDSRMLRSSFPECRKHQFRIDLFHAYILLNDSVNASICMKALQKNNGYYPWPTRDQVLCYY